MLGIVTTRLLGRNEPELGRDQPEALALDAPNDLSRETPFDSIGLADNQSSSHERGRLAEARPGVRTGFLTRASDLVGNEEPAGIGHHIQRATHHYPAVITGVINGHRHL